MPGTDNEITCCFTGHRPEKFPFIYGVNAETSTLLLALTRIIHAVYEKGFRHFISGMCIGFDLWAAEIVSELREAHPDILLEAALPFDGYGWNLQNEERALFLTALERCDRVTTLCSHYSRSCFQYRNQYMVDRSSLVIAAYNGTPGGTRNTVSYALRVGCPVRNILLPDEADPV
ncbi:MAG: SLOG family protein [Clostridiaceae bacterium]|nr:SLOG family protein [Clostridiaceae bacterium]